MNEKSVIASYKKSIEIHKVKYMYNFQHSVYRCVHFFLLLFDDAYLCVLFTMHDFYGDWFSLLVSVSVKHKKAEIRHESFLLNRGQVAHRGLWIQQIPLIWNSYRHTDKEKGCIIYLDCTTAKTLSLTHCNFLPCDKHQGVMDWLCVPFGEVRGLVSAGCWSGLDSIKGICACMN